MVSEGDTQILVFNMMASDQAFWLTQADDLREAAIIMMDAHNQRAFTDREKSIRLRALNVSRSNIAFGLMGIAIENLIKGTIIKSRPEHVDEGRLKNFPNNHQLRGLAKIAKIEMLAPEYLFMLERLTPYIEWFGRYPVPKDSKKLGIVKMSDHDFDIANKLFDVLREKLRD